MFCVYLTTYLGELLPPFYIGSSTVDKVNAGYRGSVTSKKYGKLWKAELREHPEMFKTKILSLHEDRKEAFHRECEMQELLDVVQSELFVNLSLAKPNGFFGNGSCGEAHPTHASNYTPSDLTRQRLSRALSGPGNGMFGKTHTIESRTKMSATKASRPITPEMHENISRVRRGANHPMFGKQQKPHVIEAMRIACKGVPKSIEQRAKLSKAQMGKVWWTDGVTAKLSREQPGPDFVRGRNK